MKILRRRGESHTGGEENRTADRSGCGVGQPLLLKFSQSAVIAQRVDCLGDRGGQGASLRKQQTEVVAILVCGELANHGAVLNLSCDDVECGGQVHDDCVNLAALEGLDHVSGTVEDQRIGAGLELVHHVVLRSRAGLNAELQLLQVFEALGLGSGGTLHSDDCFGGRVVGAGEVHCLLASIGNGELLDVEVPVLCARSDCRIEGRTLPYDLILGEAQLLGDCVGNCGLVAFTGGRIVVKNPRGVSGIAGGDGELTLGDGGECFAGCVSIGGCGSCVAGSGSARACTQRHDGSCCDCDECGLAETDLGTNHVCSL